MAIRSALLLALLLPCLGAEAADDDLHWQLPVRSAALYDRDWDEEWDQDERGFWWHGTHHPAALFEGELDESRRHLAGPIQDLRDLPAFLALNLRYVEAAGRVAAFESRLDGRLVSAGVGEAP